MARRVAALVMALLVTLVVAATVLPAGAQEAAADPGSREGWWGRSAPLPTPIAGLAGSGSAASSPDVPTGVIVVAAAAGRVERVAALDVGGLDGGVLVLREADGPLLQRSGTGPGVVACPISAAWAPAAGADLAGAPTADCGSGGARGTRTDGGSWRFDLSAFAGRLEEGVRLDPVVDGGATFQVGFVGADGATVEPGPAPSELSSPPPFEPSVEVSDTIPPAASCCAFGAAPSGPTPTRVAAAAPSPPVSIVGPLTGVVAVHTRSTLEGLSWPALLLAGMAAAVALLLMLALGPREVVR